MDVEIEAVSTETESTVLPYPFQRPSAIEPPKVYHELRAQCPVAKVRFPSGDEGYLVSRYDDVYTVLADPRFSRAATVEPDAPKLTATQPIPGSLFTMDPPEHTRLRRLVSSEFTFRRVQRMLPRIQELTDELLDAMEQGPKPADLNTALAFPLPVKVICELLGVPFEDRDKFRTWSDAFVSLATHGLEEVERDRMSLFMYLRDLVAAKRANPGEDLLSALVTASDEQGSLDERELVIMAATILIAGHETTVSMIGMCMLTLLRHPDQMQRLREHPQELEHAVEELLRINPIGDGGPVRVTLEQVEIAGTAIPKGSAVMGSVCSANRDARKFSDGDPEHFDARRRSADDHLAFGHGPHYCLGAALARAELRIAIGSLLRRFPGLRLAVPVEELHMAGGMMVHGLNTLPLTWD